MRIAVLDDIHEAYARFDQIATLRQRAEVVIFKDPISPAQMAEFDALVGNRERTRFPRRTLEVLAKGKTRFIAQTGEHAYHIDFQAAKELGIQIGKCAGGPSQGAPELTWGLMLCLMRQILESDAKLKRGIWDTPYGLELNGKTIGVIGYGNIGKQILHVAIAFGMRVLLWSRNMTPMRAREAGAALGGGGQVEARSLEALMSESDVVTVHLPLSPDTRGLIKAEHLALMKPSAYFLNTSRGPIVEEQALLNVLRDRRIAGAGLDVFDVEPLPPDHPFTKLDNVVLMPHAGWPTDGAYRRFVSATTEVLLAYIDGKPIPHFAEDVA